jgi:mannose PTS system EIIA component
MTISVLLITHGTIGQAILEAVKTTLGDCPLPTTAVTVSSDTDPSELCPKLERLLEHIYSQEGVLILTDLYGSTPSNIALQLKIKPSVRVISGLNLPMLLRVMNYPKLSLDELTDKALNGGKDGVICA